MLNREEFAKERKKGVGGSDIAAILGLSPFKSALDVYNDKLGLTEDTPTEAMLRGIRAEKYVLEEYASREDVELITDSILVSDKEYPFLRGNIDAKVIGQNVLVEAKSTRMSVSSWNGIIPPYYKTQVAFYAMLTDAERVDVPVLFSGWEYGLFSYYRDYEFEERIRKAAVTFWQEHVQKQTPPEPQNLNDLRCVYPKLEDNIVEADEEMQNTVSLLQQVSSKKKALDEYEKELKVKIQGYMKDASLLDAGFCKVSLKDRSCKRLDTKALKSAEPSIYANFIKETSSRILQFVGG